ncbi:PAS domain S-box protein [Solidesulfovibrio sp.]
MFKSKLVKVAGVYIGVSLLWVLGSYALVPDAVYSPLQGIVGLQTIKDIFFVSVTGCLLLALLIRYEKYWQKKVALLQKDERQYRLLFENSLDAVLLTAPDGTVLFANPSAQRVFDMTEAEICAAGRSGLVDQTDGRLPGLLKLRSETGRVQGGLRFRRKGGEVFEAELSSSVFSDLEHGARTCIILRDVSKRLRTAEELEKEMLRRTILMNTSNDGIAIFNQKHQIIETNKRFAVMLGYTEEEVLELHTWDFEAIAGENEIRERFKNFLEIDAVFETRHRRKNGEIYDVEVSASGALVGNEPMLIAISRDISERKKAEHALMESEGRFRSLFDNLEAVAVQGYNDVRDVIYWNHASEVLYGYSKQEALGRKLENLIIPAPLREAVVEAVQLWIEHGQPIPAGELRLQRKDGTSVPVFSSHVMQQKSDGKFEMFCLDIDLTELENAKSELIKAKEVAETANKTKSEFLANMSHEIRTPLNGILGMAQLLATTSLDSEQKEYVDASILSTKKLNMLLSDILDLSKIEANKLSVHNVCFRLDSMFHSLKTLFEQVGRDKDIRLSFRVADTVPVHLIGDETRVRQIFFNIIGNALKFTQQGEIVVEVSLVSPVAASETRIRLLFMVSDTGIGIRDDEMERIFKPFTQVDGSFVRTQQGAGLGLAIVKRLSELLQGSVCVASEFGVGSVFYVCLPFTIAPGTSLRTSDAVDAPVIASVPNYNILVVEDEMLNRLVACRLLHKFGCTTTTANDGREALGLLAEQQFDLILMDVQMPVMDGVAATRAIRNSPELGPKAAIPIIAMTAHAMSGDREAFLAAGMDDYVAKPFDRQVLLDAIVRVMSRKRRQPA